MKKAYVIGIGLIGGSMALDIKTHFEKCTVIGVDDNDSHLEEALKLKIIDEKATLETIVDADLIIVAVPVDVGLLLLPNILANLHEQTLVIDVGSTKSPICEAVEKHPNRRNFLATHPIAGTEFSGPSAAVHGLFKGKAIMVCEVEKTSFILQEVGMKLFRKLGMRIRYMDPKAHDKHIAYVSHLSHISSFMLGKTVMEIEKDERDIFDMAGSGFESTVRLAKSSPAMWTPIFKQNKKHVITSLDEYIANLTQFKKLLEEEKYEEVFSEMQSTNRIKEILNAKL